MDAQEIRIVSPPVEFQLNLTEGMPAGYLIYRVEAVIGILGESMEDDLLSYSLEVKSFLGWFEKVGCKIEFLVITLEN